MTERKKPEPAAEPAADPATANGEPEYVEFGSWEFVDRIPTREEVKALLETLPLRWGIATVDYLEYVTPLPQGKKTKVKRGNVVIDQTVQVYVLYVSVAGRMAMLQAAQEMHGWRVDFEPEPVTPTGVPGWLQNDDRRLVYREHVVIYERDGDQWTCLGRKGGTAWVPQTGGSGAKGSNPHEKVETAARGRALAAWAIGVLPGSGVACVPTRSEALTSDGWKTPDKLVIGELVLAYDTATDTCRWVPLEKIHQPGVADVVRVRNGGWSFVCTPDHRWVVKRKGWRERPDPGRELRTTDDLLRGRPKLVTVRPWEEPDSSVSISPREAAILGWLFTDGHFRWPVDPRSGSVTLSAVITQAKYVDELRMLLGDDATSRLQRHAGPQVIHGKEYQCREEWAFRLRNRFAYDLLRRAGVHTKDDAAAFVLRLPSESRRAMFDAMMLANGNVETGKSRYGSFTSGHRTVVDAFQLLAASLGIATSVRAANGTDCVTVGVRSTEPVMNSAVIEPAGAEEVWCPQTSLGTWVCRLDGLVTITGNSLEEIQQVAENIIAQQQRQTGERRDEPSNRPDREEAEREALQLLEQARTLRNESEYDADQRTIAYCQKRFGIDVAKPDEDPELPSSADLSRLNPGHLQIMMSGIRNSIKELQAANQEV